MGKHNLMYCFVVWFVVWFAVYALSSAGRVQSNESSLRGDNCSRVSTQHTYVFARLLALIVTHGNDSKGCMVILLILAVLILPIVFLTFDQNAFVVTRDLHCVQIWNVYAKATESCQHNE